MSITKSEFNAGFLSWPQVIELENHCKEQVNPLIHATGLRGSASQFLVSAVVKKMGGMHVVVLNDKENAAYAFNDLQDILGEDKVFFFPSPFKYPYQQETTDNTNILMRAETLDMIVKRPSWMVVVTYGEALSEKVVTKKQLKKSLLELKQGDEIGIDFINEMLFEYHFERVNFVTGPGQFSIRGGIVDIFSYANDDPYRVEFFGDEIDSIRTFDPASQLSKKNYKKIHILPNVQDQTLMETREGFLDFLPANSFLWLKDRETSKGQVKKSFEVAREAYSKLSEESIQLSPEELYVKADVFDRELEKHRVIEYGGRFESSPSLELQFNQKPQPTFNKNFELLVLDLHELKDQKLESFILSGQARQMERLHAIFEDLDPDVSFSPILQSAHEGFIDLDLKIACYTDHQIFERYHRFRLKEGFNKAKQALTIKDLTSLKKGDYVTHIDYGVGRFDGLQIIENNGKEQEAIRLIYKDSDILYVSIHSLHRIARFSGKDGTPPKINKLGTQTWKILKTKTKKKVKEIAYDLIKLYAKRKAAPGFPFTPDNYLQFELESSFIYEDTPDQFKATQDVKADMEKAHPMDRLICGDVGFGKTEVAIRAAFKAVCDSKQVAVLAPTTVLTYQHYKTFKDRLNDLPCTVDYINRFKTTKEQKTTLKNLAEGKVDILIGTHRIVGKDVKFKDLGLMIIDEEQKFGVGVKDKLKTIKENVDTLTLTATPIPRTLQFSLMKARDLSVINTPPPNRQPVETILKPFNEETIRDAIYYEVSRGGQVFFVHNRVENIQEVTGIIQRLCPEVRIGIAHGQLEGHRLEKVMMGFMEHEFDVLVATTIIESGLDISNANTIIINNAHNFGLSDLHQMRGRVGRSNRKAFCYLLAPPSSSLTTEARKRIEAIEQFSDLGSGFNIAMRDLDIRGAGNMLGGEQSGFISDIGFETYQKILDEAIQELKETEFKSLFKEEEANITRFVQDCQLDTDLEIMIPSDYVNSVNERLTLYQALADVKTENQLQQYEGGLKDRFGPVPEETIHLINGVRLQWLAEKLGFEKIVLKNEKLLCYFISSKNSRFYQTSQFQYILKFVQTNQAKTQMKERKEKLYLVFEGVRSLEDALRIMEPMVV
ncbi:MAG: transcription-repair coupling factor [Crocinitomicaceae bacterium]|nr:transcription-repair coupling factor [Crocinitomicaceae bacterium]